MSIVCPTEMAASIKLELSNLGLYGRDEELSVLQKCYHRVEGESSDESDDTSTTGGAVMALVSGGAGTGKSALVKGLSEMKIKWSSEPIFVSGKFDTKERGRESLTQPFVLLLICSSSVL